MPMSHSLKAGPCKHVSLSHLARRPHKNKKIGVSPSIALHSCKKKSAGSQARWAKVFGQRSFSFEPKLLLGAVADRPRPWASSADVRLSIQKQQCIVFHHRHLSASSYCTLSVDYPH